MNILFGERRSGRTTELIKQAVKENAYILVYDHARAHFIRKLATELGYPSLLFPITFQELMHSRNTGFVTKLLIDDADEILESLCARQGWKVLMMSLCKREGQFFELPGNGKPPELSPELKRYIDHVVAIKVRNITVDYDWHDIKKEPAPEGRHILVTLDHGGGDLEVTEIDYGVCRYMAEHEHVEECAQLLRDVVAWMELPGPWKGDSK